jgi:hypothetical protein
MGTAAIVILGSLLAFGGGLLLRQQSGQQRTAELRAVAKRRGWGFRDEVPFDTIPDLERFELFRPGRRKELSNLMTSPADGPRFVVFDYAYTTGGGNSQRRHRQTVVYTTHDELSLPSFSLRPEHFFHRVAGAFGYQDIDLDGHPEFSRLFLLRGENEAAVRAGFNDRVAEFLERRPGTCAAGIGRELLYWRAGRRARPEEVDGLVEEGLELAARYVQPHREM